MEQYAFLVTNLFLFIPAKVTLSIFRRGFSKDGKLPLAMNGNMKNKPFKSRFERKNLMKGVGEV